MTAVGKLSVSLTVNTCPHDGPGESDPSCRFGRGEGAGQIAERLLRLRRSCSSTYLSLLKTPFAPSPAAETTVGIMPSNVPRAMVIGRLASEPRAQTNGCTPLGLWRRSGFWTVRPSDQIPGRQAERVMGHDAFKSIQMYTNVYTDGEENG